jgi:hypothetical protein
MRNHHTAVALLLSALAAASAGAARADVTIEQQTSFDVAIIKAHGTATEYTTADKQRRDSDMHCEGFMSMLCGNTQTGEIIRLDREVTWQLEPKKREYRESPFLTAAQRQAAEQQMQAMMEKMKQCPAPHNTAAAPDTSKCQMGTPKLDVKQTGTHATFAGHDAQLTQVALTQSCSNPQTGDVCDFLFTLDSWLTQDQIAGLDDRKAFEESYRKRLGLGDPNSPMQKQLAQFLAPYAASLKELSSRTGDLKGYPLKTAMRIAFGGEHCAASKGQGQSAGAANSNVVADAGQAAGDAATGSAAGSAGSAAGTAAANAAGNSAGGSVLGSAASAFSSKLVSGLFAKKKADSAAGGTGSGASGSTPGSGLPPGMVQAAQITIETTAITPGAIPATRFDIPAGWKLIQPPPSKEPKEFSCPKDGA